MGEGEGKDKDKDHLVTKIRKVYSNRFDAVKQSLKQARRNRRALEEQSIEAGTSPGNSNQSVRTDAATITSRTNKPFDIRGFSAIVAISFASTGFLFAMRKYIFQPGEFWKQGSHSSHNRRRPKYHYRTFHNHNYGSSSSSNTSSGGIYDKDHMTKHYLTILELPTNNLRPTVKDVKAAYRKISLRTHPDVVRSMNKNNNKDLKSTKYLEERFIMATKAHDELLKELKP